MLYWTPLSPTLPKLREIKQTPAKLPKILPSFSPEMASSQKEDHLPQADQSDKKVQNQTKQSPNPATAPWWDKTNKKNTTTWTQLKTSKNP